MPASDDNLFASALALPAAERAAYLAQACSGDDALRARVEKLLHAHEEARSFLNVPAAARRTAMSGGPSEDRVGDRIGRYKILQKIGEGGCGTVYMAEQEEPVVRRVALKIIKLGMDTKEVIARFEAERQALALMDHPNIARVFDGGATASGRPYFVMELVRGVPITKYCDGARLSAQARLELFTQVCHAVQHAHQKGVIHRDLKPSNILVTVNDGVAVPKVIDFGIAKATQGRLTDATLFTAFEQCIGTPVYMSPEQAAMTSVDVDTRSDIYSLGVLLYELLTGRPPFDPKALVAAGLDEMRRQIREIEPPRPSARVNTLPAIEQTTTANLRQIEVPKLVNLLRGDLDWIIMRCLEKDRARRYETANALALDLLRHSRDEPVAARPPSMGYRIQKLIRRHKLVFASTALILFSLVAGLGLSTWLLLKEQAARRRAEAAEQAQSLLRRQIEELPRLFGVAGELENQGQLAEAEQLLRRVLLLERDLLGGQHGLLADTLCDLGNVLRKQGRLAEAETQYSASLALYGKLLDQGQRADVNPTNLTRIFRGLGEMLEPDARVGDLESYFAEFLSSARQAPALRSHVLRLRVDFFARHWRWSECANDLAQVVELTPDNFQNWYQLGPLLLHTGNLAGYRTLCQAIQTRFGTTKDASIARRAAKVSLLIPPENRLLTAATVFAEQAIKADKNNYWAWFGQSLLAYRQGNYAGATDWARKLLAASDSEDQRFVQIHMILAMSLFRMGQPQEATTLLAKGRTIADVKLPRTGSGRLLIEDWENPVITGLLQREAETLIEGPPALAGLPAK
jgi:serine/threonine protein kinase/Flp pilus assembly protein TadD